MRFIFLLCFLLTSSIAFAEEVHEVAIEKFSFVPAEITIKAGDKVRWINKEKRQYHSVWFTSEDKEEPEYFFPDETFEKKFDKPGKYAYRCGPHEEMNGVIIVR